MLTYLLCSSLLIIPQYFLCRKKSKLWGLIIPILCVVIAVIFSCSFSTTIKEDYETFTYNDLGEIVEQDKSDTIASPVSNHVLIDILISFLVMNVPTVLTIIEYVIVRRKLRMENEMNKIASHGLM